MKMSVCACVRAPACVWVYTLTRLTKQFVKCNGNNAGSCKLKLQMRSISKSIRTQSILALNLRISAPCILNKTLSIRINIIQGQRAPEVSHPVLHVIPLLANVQRHACSMSTYNKCEESSLCALLHGLWWPLVTPGPLFGPAHGVKQESVLMSAQEEMISVISDGEIQLKTYFKTALSPCLTVMLSFNTESPLLAGTPAGTRNNNLSPRTTRHFPGTAK